MIAPYWVSYIEQIKFARAIPVLVESSIEKGFHITGEEIASKICNKTKAILINSPNNPTGVVYPKDTLIEIYEVAKKYDLWIISDEIYEKLIYDENKHYSIATFNEDAKNRTILINGVSKAYSMTGWRIGYAAANEHIIKTMSSLQGHTTSNPTSIAQAASIVGLNECDDEIEMMRQKFDERRKYIVERLKNMPGVECENPEDLEKQINEFGSEERVYA